MKRLLLYSIMAAIAVAAVALIGFRSSSGPDVASAHTGQTNPHLEIDMIQDAGGGTATTTDDVWCNPVDPEVHHVAGAGAIGDTYYVAICLTQAPASVQGFDVEFLYDDTLNSCTNVANSGACLDDNPDANTGLTAFSAPRECSELPAFCSDATAPYDFCDDDTDGYINDGCPTMGALPEDPDAIPNQCTDNVDNDGDTLVNDGCPPQGADGLAESVGMGGGWTCNLGSGLEPVCDKNPGETGAGKGMAFISCISGSGAYTLPAGATVSAPLAVVKLHASAVGTDNLAFGTVAVYGAGIETLDTYGAIDYKDNTPTPTLTNTPTVTSTPLPPTSTPTPTPTPLYAQNCDIGVLAGLTANPASLFMNVGDPPAIVTLNNSWKNYGAVPPAQGRTCQFARAMGAQLQVTDFTVFSAIPAGLGVRMEPEVDQAGYGDVCMVCYGSGVGKSIGECLDPLSPNYAHGPFDYVCLTNPYSFTCSMNPWDANYLPTCCNPMQFTYVPVGCDEAPLTTLPYSTLDGSCEDGIDQQADNPPPTPPATPDPHKGTCDWGGFSKLCTPPTTPDSYCKDVQAIGLRGALRQVLAVDASVAQTREVKIECRHSGVYPLVIFAGVSQATDKYAGGSMTGATDPNPANDRSFVLIPVVCGAEMVKDCDTVAAGIQTNCNLWLMNPKYPGGMEPDGTILPPADANGCVVAAKGKGCLAVDVWLKSAGDADDPNDSDPVPECLGAWEHQVRYDHKIVSLLNNLNPGFLTSTGRVANCSVTVYSENWILEGCVTTGTPNGPCGDGIIEKMLIIPQTQDLIYRGVFRPTKDNGVVTNIVDDNCEITDIYAEPMGGTLPGGLTPVCGNMSITVRMLEGDTDLDCDVDVVDDQAIAFRYGSSWGLQLYDQWYDLEPKFADQDIDIKDLQFIFGRNYSSCQHPIPDDQSIPVAPAQPDP